VIALWAGIVLRLYVLRSAWHSLGINVKDFNRALKTIALYKFQKLAD